MIRFGIISIILLSVVITSFLLYSQRINDNQFELVKTEDFAKSIKNWGFPATKPIIAIDDKQITWISNFKENHFNLPADALKIIFSKNSNYFAIVRLNYNSEYNNKNKELQVDVYTASKEKLYEIQRNQYYDDPFPFIAISDFDGSLIIGQNTIGEIWFYNQNGLLNDKIRLFSDTEYDLERILQIAFSKDGTTAAILAGKRGASPSDSNAPNPSAEPHLFLFSLQGEELLRKPLPDFNAAFMAISDSGQYIAASSFTITLDGNLTKRTTIVDNTGNEISHIGLLCKLAEFSTDSKFLVLADNDTAQVFDLTSGNILWSYGVSKTDGMISAVDISNNGEIVALLIAKSEFKDRTFIFTNPLLKIFNNKGSLLQKMEITNQEFEKPAFNLSDDAKKIFIGFKNAYQIYQVR